MRIVIVHYHLQTGGVTRVIQHAATALGDQGHEVLLLSGEPTQQAFPSQTRLSVLPCLAYEERRHALSARAVAREMQQAARDCFGDLPDLWHIHNHCLGKNLGVPGAVLELARNRQRLLLQIHDFAEDGRPALYHRLLTQIGSDEVARLSDQLYPVGEHVHYAALNGRDRAFLAAAGIPESNLHLLPNAVWFEGEPPPREQPDGDERRLWLYPTRAIRRKNLGEFILWSALSREGDRFATTQAPQNPTEQPRYRRWVDFARRLKLPMEFELGQRYRGDFHALLGSAHSLVTTSVGEGFGLAFLEPWLMGRPLAGRNLPEITQDFQEVGIDLAHLYPRLNLPLEWLNRERLFGAVQATLSEVMAAYGRIASSEDTDRASAAMCEGDRIDFGRLDEVAQEEAIRQLAASPESRSALSSQRLSLTPQTTVAANQGLVRKHFSLAGYRQRLLGIYQQLLAQPAGPLQSADGAALLDRFLAPERLTLLRT